MNRARAGLVARTPARSSGFTLIECIMATLIVLLATITVVSIIPMTYRGASVDKQRLTALSLARNVVNQVRARPFGADPASLQGDITVSGEMVEGNSVQQVYTVDKVVTSIPPGSDHGTVTVTMKWDEGTGVGSSRVTKSLNLTGGISREP